MRPLTIALDGPAGSGKSTLGREMASRLGYAMLDAGLLYRLVTLRALAADISVTTRAQVVPFSADVLAGVELAKHGTAYVAVVDGRPLADMELHTESISKAVPVVAAYAGVRERVRLVQADIRRTGPTILAGRDIATVVAPDAELKLYLDVSLDERVSRRQWSHESSKLSREEIAEALETRDELDRGREFSPLSVAPDAFVVRTDKLTVDETVSALIMMCGLEHA